MMNIYTTGGALRDLLLGRSAKDTDFAFTDTVSNFLETYPETVVIQSAGQTICLLKGQEYTPINNNDIFEDLRRRDFTINAMSLDLNGKIYAHEQSFADLQNKELRPCSADALTAVPIRAFRAARFAAELPDFLPSMECNAQMLECARENKLHNIAPEQIAKELRKALCSSKPGNFLRLLSKNCCLEPWFSELTIADSIPAGPIKYHDSSVLEHTARVMDAVPSMAKTLLPDTLETNRSTELAVWFALCHDLGKVMTPKDILPHHYQHDENGAPLATNLGKRLRMPDIFIKGGAIAARWHMIAGKYETLRPGSKVKLLSAVPAHIFTAFLICVCADSGRKDLYEQMTTDKSKLTNLHLPTKWQNLGKRSGEMLFALQCQILGK